MQVLVLGAGAWGTAVALAACRHPAAHQVTLWARNPAQADAMRQQRSNTQYLPGIALPDTLHLASGAIAPLLSTTDLVILATPVSALRAMLTTLRTTPTLPPHCPVVWLCKGVEPPAGDHPVITGLLPHEVQAQVAPGLRTGVLSGPSFALEVAQDKPTALVAASPHPAVQQALLAAFHSGTVRIYANEDSIGVELGGAVKNVLAIATGFCDGLELGLNARAALVTRGLAEMTRLGVALGAKPETFMGMAGVGDLVLTATGNLSRNRKVGLLLAQGLTLPQILSSLGHVAEGVYCARAVLQRATQAGVEMPITQGVVQLLDGQASPARIVQELLAREPAQE